jgi:hypothetical protein
MYYKNYNQRCFHRGTRERDRSGEGNLLKPPKNTKVGFLTGCQDRPYAFGLAMALVSSGICLEVIGRDNEDCPEFHTTCNLRFLDWEGHGQKSPFCEENCCDYRATMPDPFDTACSPSRKRISRAMPNPNRKACGRASEPVASQDAYAKKFTS